MLPGSTEEPSNGLSKFWVSPVQRLDTENVKSFRDKKQKEERKREGGSDVEGERWRERK